MFHGVPRKRGDAAEKQKCANHLTVENASPRNSLIGSPNPKSNESKRERGGDRDEHGGRRHRRRVARRARLGVHACLERNEGGRGPHRPRDLDGRIVAPFHRKLRRNVVHAGPTRKRRPVLPTLAHVHAGHLGQRPHRSPFDRLARAVGYSDVEPGFADRYDAGVRRDLYRIGPGLCRRAGKRAL